MRSYIEDWCISNIEYFNPLKWVSAEERYVRRKSFSELSMYLYILRLHSRPINQKIRQFVLDICSSNSYAALAISKPSAFNVLLASFLYPHFEKTINTKTRFLLSEYCNEPSLSLMERVPYRYLDWDYCCKVLDLKKDLSLQKNALSLSCLRGRPVAGLINDDDAYAITHSIFYLRNFGAPVAMTSETQRFFNKNLKNDIDAVTCRYLHEQNMDVALELAASQFICHGRSSKISAYASLCANDQIRSIGFLSVPPPSYILQLSDVSESFRAWAERYHPLLVAAINNAIADNGAIEVGIDSSEIAAINSYGELLSAISVGDVYETCIGLAKTQSTENLPSYHYQIMPAMRLLSRHLALVDQCFGSEGILVDAKRGLEVDGAPNDEGFESVANLARIVLQSFKSYI